MLIAAFVLGLGSALHCIGMCGPLAMVIPMPKQISWLHKAALLAVYHTWRVGVYVGLGLATGLAVETSRLLPILVRHQQQMTLGLGILLFGLSLLPFTRHLFERWANKPLGRPLKVLMSSYQRVKRNNLTLAVAILGLIHGLIPCGLVYSAILLSMLNATAFNTGLTMLTFGLATSLNLIIFRILGDNIRPVFGTKWLRVSLSLVALLLVFRSQLPILKSGTDTGPQAIEAINCHK